VLLTGSACRYVPSQAKVSYRPLKPRSAPYLQCESLEQAQAALTTSSAGKLVSIMKIALSLILAADDPSGFAFAGD
jgi:hypothetical protein